MRVLITSRVLKSLDWWDRRCFRACLRVGDGYVSILNLAISTQRGKIIIDSGQEGDSWSRACSACILQSYLTVCQVIWGESLSLQSLSKHCTFFWLSNCSSRAKTSSIT
jgi:hypothetical protein